MNIKINKNLKNYCENLIQMQIQKFIFFARVEGENKN